MKRNNLPSILIVATTVLLLSFYFGSKRDLASNENVSEDFEELDSVEPEPQKETFSANESKGEVILESDFSEEKTKFTQAQNSSDYQRLPKNTVAYQVIGDEAVAFGDVILGRLKGDSKKTGGIYKPPERAAHLWPDGVVPYAFDKSLSNRKRVAEVIEYFNNSTDLQFVPYQGEENAIVFTKTDKHCLSYLGMVGGHQPIRLSDGCGFNEIIHEIMHSLGFIHEQSRPDRDEFIEILWDNIKDPFQGQFEIIPDFLSTAYSNTRFDFDFKSIMLYKPNFFSKPNKRTMKSIQGEEFEPSQNGLSELDHEKIRILYGY